MKSENIVCDGCGLPAADLEYLEDEDMFYCPLCGTRTPADQGEDDAEESD